MKIMASGPITSWHIDGEKLETVSDFIFLGCKITADGDCSHKVKRHLLLGRKAMTNLDSIWKIRDITLPTKVHIVKAMVFFSSHVWMWELDYKESWVPKNWCFWTVVLEKTPLESPLDCKEIKPVNLKGNHLWILLGGTCAETEAPILCHPDAKNWLTGEDCNARKKLKARGIGGNRGWDGQMASLTQWTWAWANSRRQWRTGKPGMLQSMGSQKVGHDLVTEQ